MNPRCQKANLLRVFFHSSKMRDEILFDKLPQSQHRNRTVAFQNAHWYGKICIFSERPETTVLYDIFQCSHQTFLSNNEAKQKIDIFQLNFFGEVLPYSGRGGRRQHKSRRYGAIRLTSKLLAFLFNAKNKKIVQSARILSDF